MADLVQRLGQDAELSQGKRRDLASAIRRLCKFTDIVPATVPATMHEAKRLLDQINAVSCDLTPRSFRNMRRLVRNALHQYRPDQRDDRPAKFVLPPMWAALVEAAPD